MNSPVKAINLETTIYDLQWWEYDVNEQNTVKLMLLRTQRPRGLAAYDYFVCNLQIYFRVHTDFVIGNIVLNC